LIIGVGLCFLYAFHVSRLTTFCWYYNYWIMYKSLWNLYRINRIW